MDFNTYKKIRIKINMGIARKKMEVLQKKSRMRGRGLGGLE
jgi:hypothetical protein